MPLTAFLFPGQGSQKPGMGKDLAQEFSAARDVFARADETLGAPLSTLCFEGPADELPMTVFVPPADDEPAFAAMVGAYAAGLDAGRAPRDAFLAATRGSNWEPASLV